MIREILYESPLISRQSVDCAYSHASPWLAIARAAARQHTLLADEVRTTASELSTGHCQLPAESYGISTSITERAEAYHFLLPDRMYGAAANLKIEHRKKWLGPKSTTRLCTVAARRPLLPGGRAGGWNAAQ